MSLIQSRRERAREWKGSAATSSRPGCQYGEERKRIVVGPWAVWASELLLQAGVLEGLSQRLKPNAACAVNVEASAGGCADGQGRERDSNKERSKMRCLVIVQTV
jgi:hypothetical protein